MGEDPLPDGDELVALLPEYSPSFHSLEVFNHEAEGVQSVTRGEAEDAGFTPCVRCWDVEPDEPKSLEDLGKLDDHEHEEDHDG